MPLQDGQTFAGYTILRTLGVGGMGEVYLAQHPRLPRPDALKVLPKAVGSGEFRARFNREADLASKLFHPHIVGIHDRGEDDGQLWITMDYVAGTDLNQLMSDRYPSGMPAAQVAEIVTAVASALDYAHQLGLLHRDVKPANILLSDPETASQRIFLADFGIARTMGEATGLTATNTTIGTIAYASPEQLSGRSMDGRSDQYSLACTAYDLLTGTAPFGSGDPISVVGQHLGVPAPPIGSRLPQLAALDPVFARALAKDPVARYASCTEFAGDLTRRLQSSNASPTVVAPWPAAPPMMPPPYPPSPSPPYPAAPSLTSQSGSNRALLIIGGIACAVVLLVVGVLAVVYLGRDSTVAGPSESQTREPTSTSGPTMSVTSETSGNAAPTASTAPGPSATTLSIDGQPQPVSGSTVCSTAGTKLVISAGDAASAVGATIGLGQDPAVDSVALGNIDGLTLAYAQGTPGASAVAHKEGKVYTISGTATGIDMKNPLEPVSKSFELVVVCP